MNMIADRLRDDEEPFSEKLNEAAASEIERLEKDLDLALTMLAEWCIDVEYNGAGWDDWDESYKNAAYRPNPLREQLDAKLKQEREYRGIDAQRLSSGAAKPSRCNVELGACPRRKEMEREHHRYMVLKYKDIVKHLTEDEQMALVGLANKVDAGRRSERKQGPIECVVVEADWPEYLDTWSKIAARVDGVPFQQARMQQFRDYDELSPNAELKGGR